MCKMKQKKVWSMAMTYSSIEPKMLCWCFSSLLCFRSFWWAPGVAWFLLSISKPASNSLSTPHFLPSIHPAIQFNPTLDPTLKPTPSINSLSVFVGPGWCWERRLVLINWSKSRGSQIPSPSAFVGLMPMMISWGLKTSPRFQETTPSLTEFINMLLLSFGLSS